MSAANILLPLRSLFGDRQFEINQITDEPYLWSIKEELGTAATTLVGIKGQLGKWLTANDGITFDTPIGGRIAVTVIRRADESIPGIYQIHIGQPANN